MNMKIPNKLPEVIARTYISQGPDNYSHYYMELSSTYFFILNKGKNTYYHNYVLWNNGGKVIFELEEVVFRTNASYEDICMLSYNNIFYLYEYMTLEQFVAHYLDRLL